jgi:hypothetical protein
MPEAVRVVITNWCGGTAWAVRIVCDGYRFQNLGTRGENVVGMGPAPPPGHTLCHGNIATTSRLVLAKFRRACESGEAANAALPAAIQFAGNAGEADGGGASTAVGEICTSMHLEGPASRCLLAHATTLRALSREAWTRLDVARAAITRAFEEPAQPALPPADAEQHVVNDLFVNLAAPVECCTAALQSAEALCVAAVAANAEAQQQEVAAVVAGLPAAAAAAGVARMAAASGAAANARDRAAELRNAAQAVAVAAENSLNEAQVLQALVGVQAVLRPSCSTLGPRHTTKTSSPMPRCRPRTGGPKILSGPSSQLSPWPTAWP